MGVEYWKIPLAQFLYCVMMRWGQDLATDTMHALFDRPGCKMYDSQEAGSHFCVCVAQQFGGLGAPGYRAGLKGASVASRFQRFFIAWALLTDPGRDAIIQIG